MKPESVNFKEFPKRFMTMRRNAPGWVRKAQFPGVMSKRTWTGAWGSGVVGLREEEGEAEFQAAKWASERFR